MSDEKKVVDPEVEKRKIKSVKTMKELMTYYYIDAKTARENGKKVAWITSGGPVEPLIAMDVIPIYPENHGAMIGASKMGIDLCEKAEAMGYARDLCSYARADISCSTVNGGPIGGLPDPDFLVCCNNICGTVLKWYEVQARYYDVPLFILDTPFIHTDFTDEAKRYVIRQMNEYIGFLENACAKKLDLDKMNEVGKLSIEAQHLWQKVLDTTMNKPAPMTAFDAFFHLAMIVTLRGTPTAVDYYKQLLAEMEERIARGIGMVPNEKYRLLWDNLPIWFRTRWLSDKLLSHNACLVADSYTSAWSGVVHLIDENNYLESMAIAYSNVHLNVSVDQMFDTMKGLIQKYDVDGLVMHSNRSCKPYSLGQYDLAKMVMNELNLPTLILEADMVDERNFSESQVETRIDAFMEVLETKK
ncbi:MAG: 2-hydroxyacyl-CoA dehydratase [Desulfobacterales bacterium]|nr:2-hydroxyacyl-CoA dehydratase [Desulfobacterales bacterium]